MILDWLLLSMLLNRIVHRYYPFHSSPEIICIFHAVVFVLFCFVLFCFVFCFCFCFWFWFFFCFGFFLVWFSLWAFLFLCAFCSYVIIAPMLNDLFMYPVCLCLITLY